MDTINPTNTIITTTASLAVAYITVLISYSSAFWEVDGMITVF
jgi:hypothetical protein